MVNMIAVQQMRLEGSTNHKKNFVALFQKLQGDGTGLKINEDADLRNKNKNKWLCWFAYDVLSSAGPTKVQLLELCCSSISVLALLLSSYLFSP